MEIILLSTDSSPDVPLATFSPSNQFADAGGFARFFCEAFVGRNDLADIAISIKWYQITKDNQDLPISDEQQEIVKREDEQIIGSYLTIPHVTVDQYGRYMCRIEIGNSPTHRLEVSAELINALTFEADRNFILMNPYFLASCAAVITVFLFFLLMHTQHCWRQPLVDKDSNELDILKLRTKSFQSPTSKLNKLTTQRMNSSHDDVSIMIDVL
jgi:hypothetical protein